MVYAGESIWIMHPEFPPQRIFAKNGKLVMEEIGGAQVIKDWEKENGTQSNIT